jgi:uncharacterized protein YbjQ (UPF0145 family)
MKTSEIVAKHGFNQKEFDLFVKNSEYPFESTFFTGVTIIPDDAEKITNHFKRDLEIKKRNEAAAKAAELEKERLQALQIETEQKRIQDEEREAQEQLQKAKMEKREALANMLITSGFNFDGYKITKYSGYISGDDAVQIGRGTAGFFSQATNVGDSLMVSLSEIRRNAVAELKESAYALGCNAVIGVDFDYITLDPETASSTGGTMYLPYVFGVTANGNAVIIEKEN